MPYAKEASPWIDSGVAASVASRLRQCEPVNDVYVFGSVARTGAGRDLDMVVTADEPVVEDFLTKVNGIWAQRGLREPEDVSKHISGIRWEVAQTMLPLTTEELIAAQVPQTRWVSWLDLIILPDNWLDRVDELQPRLPSDDPNFMRNIGHDAVLLEVEFDHNMSQ